MEWRICQELRYKEMWLLAKNTTFQITQIK